MKFFFSLISFALISVSTQASFIYQADPVKIRSLNFKALAVSDSIPSLGVLITEKKLAARADLKFLGEDHMRQFIQPESSKETPQGMWGLQAIQAESAWSESQGDGVIVGISDTGVDSKHPDLVDSMWTNSKEIPGNGIDDDHNGFVDDVHGWNFVDNNNDVSEYSSLNAFTHTLCV